MKSFTVTSPTGVTIHSGILALSADQSRRRRHLLTDLGEGLFEVVQQIQFKQGETFGYDGEVNKALLQKINPVKKKK